MKKLILALTLIFSLNTTFSQTEEWLFYDFDSIVSIEMPGEVYEWDTIMNDVNIYQIMSHVDNTLFIVQKVLKQNKNEEELLEELPHDDKSLDKTYKEFIKGLLKNSPYSAKSKHKISLNDLKGYKIELHDHNKKTVSDIRVFLLNKEYYTFTYFNNIDFNDEAKNYFFNSIMLSETEEISQHLGTDNSGEVAGAIGRLTAYLIIGIGIVLAIVRATRKRNR